VKSVLLAELAVFIHLKPVRVILLVLLSVVVSLFALSASECDLNSHFRHLLTKFTPYKNGYGVVCLPREPYFLIIYGMRRTSECTLSAAQRRKKVRKKIDLIKRYTYYNI